MRRWTRSFPGKRSIPGRSSTCWPDWACGSSRHSQVAGSYLEQHPLFEPDPVVPDNAGRSLLVWGAILFVLSVLPLVGPGAPQPLRVIGVLYAMLGFRVLIGSWLG
jgi:hypothetical protein